MKKSFLLSVIISIFTSTTFAQIDSLTHVDPAQFLLEPDEDILAGTLRASIANDSSNLRNYLILGSLLESQLKFDEAEAIYQRALAVDSTCSKCWQQFAGVLLAKGMVRNALRSYNQSLSLDSTNSSARIQLARLLKRENLFKESLKHWWFLLDNDSTNYYIWEQIGDCTARIGEKGWAWTAYINSFNYNPKNLPVAAKIGQMGVQGGVWPIFYQPIVDSALKVDSLYIPLLRVKGTMFFNDKMYREALEIYNIAFSQGDTSKITLKHMGISCYSIGQFSRSSDLLEKAFLQDSLDVVLNYFYANSLINIGDRLKGINVMNKTEFFMTPDSLELSMIYETRADGYSKGSDFANAVKQTQRAYELNPKKVEHIYRIGQIYDFNLKDSLKALEYYELYLSKIVDLPENSNSRKFEGMATRALKRLKEGLFFEDALIIIPAAKKGD